MKTILFYLGLSTLFTHELDAVSQSEWRLLYILRDLPEEISKNTFVALHVPLFAIIFWLVFNENINTKKWSRIILAAFFVIHAGLHKNLENHPLYTFNSPLSQGLIFGAGLFGLLYLVAEYVANYASQSAKINA